MSTMASQITSLTIVYSTVHSGADQRKHQSSASLAFVGEFTGNRWIHKGPVTQNFFPFADVIMIQNGRRDITTSRDTSAVKLPLSHQRCFTLDALEKTWAVMLLKYHTPHPGRRTEKLWEVLKIEFLNNHRKAIVLLPSRNVMTSYEHYGVPNHQQPLFSLTACLR